MIEFNWSRCRKKPFPHQIVGVKELVLPINAKTGRVIPKVMAIFDRVGAGKSKQEIDAAQILFEDGQIDSVLVLTPGFARSVWLDPDPILGEVAKHAWNDVPNVIHEFHAKTPTIEWEPKSLNWVVTNYEFIRQPERLETLCKQMRGRTFKIIADEAWAIKSHKAKQFKAALKLRRMADRASILNGTPGLPMDLFAPFYFLDPRIIGFTETPGKAFFFYRARYAVMGGFQNKKIITYQNLEELQAKTKPYALQRETPREAWSVLPPVIIEARLTEPTWKLYRAMRDEMVVWLSSTEASTAGQAIVKSLRLAQLTSGFLGGVETDDEQPALAFDENRPPWVKTLGKEDRRVPGTGKGPVREIGREKLDAMLEWLASVGRPDRLLVWCRFRAELERAAVALSTDYDVHKLYGQQTPDERSAAKRSLAPETVVDGPTAVCGQPQAGGAALNLSGASVAITLSNDFSLKTYVQKNGRIDRPGQTRAITFADVVAVGPKGQKTIDHHIIKALREDHDIAEWTAAVWRQKLLEE